MRRFLFVLLLFFFTLPAFAHHIVGGEMIYTYLGPGSSPNTKKYQITLKLFRDDGCDLTSTSCAQLPDVVYIGVFNKDNNAEYSYPNVQKSTYDAVPINPYPPCIINAPNLQYHVASYSFVVDLPNNTSGYTATFQTCCRVDVINNADNTKDNLGATYSCDIPAIADNSPAFDTKIDVLCQHKKFTLDFSSTDKDGDSLVYSFVNAYNGGAAINASPFNPAPPPYSSVNYINGYTASQPLGTLATINSSTGIISGIAPDAGAYIVCVSVKSYRNGQFVADHRKDFIVNIRDCNFTAADLLPKYITCDGFSLTFKNETSIPSGSTYSWNFGDPKSGANNSSTSSNPTHIYSDTGIYQVKLKIISSGGCEDSATTLSYVYPGFFPGFTTQGQCKNTQIQFTDITKTNYGTVNSWSWDFGDLSTNADTSHLKNPKYTYAASGNYDVSLLVTNDKGCSDTISKTIAITDKPDLQVTNDTLICSIDTLQLNAIGNGTAFWTPNYNINNQNNAAPLVSPKTPTTYYVTLTDPYGCKATDSVFVNVKQFVTIDAGPDTSICRGDAVQLNPISDALHYKWSPAAPLNNDTAKYPVATPLATTTFYVIGNIGKCQSTDSVKVKVTPLPGANPKIDTSICLGNNIQFNLSGGSIYTWSPATYLNNASIPDPISNPNTSIQYIVTVKDTLGCDKPVYDTVVVNVQNIIADAGPRDTSIVVNQPLQLNATGGQFYLWSPSTGLNAADISNPVAMFNQVSTIDYVVKVSNATGCSATDTITVRVYQVIPGMFIPNAFSPNGDGVNDVFRPIAIGMKQVNYFKVYNRWGQLVYSSTNLETGWDGTFKGKPQDPAVYVWIVEGVDYQNKKIAQKGTVTLIR